MNYEKEPKFSYKPPPSSPLGGGGDSHIIKTPKNHPKRPVYMWNLILGCYFGEATIWIPKVASSTQILDLASVWVSDTIN